MTDNALALCALTHRKSTGIFTQKTPSGFASVSGPMTLIRHQSQAFQNGMAQRGFACKDNCAKDPITVAVSIPAKVAPSKSAAAPLQTVPAAISASAEIFPVENLAVGTLVLPATEPMVLYKDPAKDSERVERLYKSDLLSVKGIAGKWINVVTASGNAGWVVGPLVPKQ